MIQQLIETSPSSPIFTHSGTTRSIRSNSPGMRRNSSCLLSGKSIERESWCIPARFSRRNRSGVSCEALLTTTTHGNRPGLPTAAMMSSKSPRARGSPPDMFTTGARMVRQIFAYPSGSSRVSLIGPPQLQCQQFAVQACVTSKDTVRGFLRTAFHAPCISMRTAILLGTFMEPPSVERSV